MKILHVLDHSIPLHSGYTFRTRAILQQQRKLGWDTAQVTSSKHSVQCPDEEDVDGFHFYRTRPGSGFFAGLPALNQLDVVNSLAKRLDEVIEKEHPDILHAHSPALNGLAALRAGHRHRLPVVYECRAFWEDAAADHGTSRPGGPRYRLTRALETRVFRQAVAVTTICEGLQKDIIARGVAEEKVTIIPNAVDIERFSMERTTDPVLATKLGLQDRPVIGFIGSFYAYEGLSLLLDAMPSILESLPEIKLLLVGGGPEEQRLKQRAAQADIKDRVVFAGRVPHEEVQRYYDLVDVFVYPRQKIRLTDLVTPLKPLEAMARGRLVVASDVGGHRELIQDGTNGFLFAAGDVRALAESVARLFRQPESWRQLAANGRNFVETERSWPVSVARYAGVYGGLVPHQATYARI